MQTKSQMDDDEITLVDVYEFFVDGWLLLVLTAAVGLGLGWAASFALPERFQASAIVTPGLVGGQLVEELPRTAAALRSVASYNARDMQNCPDVTANQPIDSFVSNLSVVGVPNTMYLRLSYLSGSPQAATQCLEATLDTLRRNEARMFERRETMIKRAFERSVEALAFEQEGFEKQLDALQTRRVNLIEDMKTSRAFLDALYQRIDQDPAVLDKEATMESMLVVTSLAAARREVRIGYEALGEITDRTLRIEREAQEKIAKLTVEVANREQALQPPNTLEAHINGGISASDRPVSPNRKILALLGLFVGGGLGLVYLMLRAGLRSARARKAARLGAL